MSRDLFPAGLSPSLSVAMHSAISTGSFLFAFFFVSQALFSQFRLNNSASEIRAPGPGKLTLTYEPSAGGEAIKVSVYKFDGAGVAMAMYNTDEVCSCSCLLAVLTAFSLARTVQSIIGFAHPCFQDALQVHRPLYPQQQEHLSQGV